MIYEGPGTITAAGPQTQLRAYGLNAIFICVFHLSRIVTFLYQLIYRPFFVIAPSPSLRLSPGRAPLAASLSFFHPPSLGDAVSLPSLKAPTLALFQLQSSEPPHNSDSPLWSSLLASRVMCALFHSSCCFLHSIFPLAPMPLSLNCSLSLSHFHLPFLHPVSLSASTCPSSWRSPLSISAAFILHGFFSCERIFFFPPNSKFDSC